MFYFVYVLESIRQERWYIGYFPGSIEVRLQKHNRGEVFSTKPYRPWELIFYEGYKNEQDALRREKYLKTNQGARMLKFMLKAYRDSKKK